MFLKVKKEKTNMKILKTIFLTSLLVSLNSCDNDSPEEDTMTDPDPTPVMNDITYEKDVKQIIDANCIECHSNPPQRGAPMSLITFEDVQSRSGSISDRMKSASNPMPPESRGGLLDATVVKVVDDWIAGGLKER